MKSILCSCLGPLFCSFFVFSTVPSHAETRPPNILIICVDTLRADHLSLYGYERKTSPNIDAFFSQGTVYERCYASEASTSPNVTSILTGLLPQNHRVRLHFQKLDPLVRTLPEYLRDAGYKTMGAVSNVCLTDEAMGWSRRFDHFDDYVSQSWPDRDVYERDAEGTTDAVLNWLATNGDPYQPHFIYAHYMDPHGPYLPPQNKPVDFTHEAPQPIDIERLLKYIRIEGVNDALEYIDLYDEEIAYADREIGRLLAEYEKGGFGANAIVILTADHGESFMEHENWFEHGYHVYEEIMHVPLAIRGGKFGPARVSTPVTSPDITPTLLEAARVTSATTRFDGVALSQSPPERMIFIEATTGGLSRRGVVDKGMKWVMEVKIKTGFVTGIMDFFSGETSTFVRDIYRYDLNADAGEQNRLAWTDTPASKALQDLIDADPDPAGLPEKYAKGMRIASPKVAPDISKEAQEKLKGIGYVR